MTHDKCIRHRQHRAKPVMRCSPVVIVRMAKFLLLSRRSHCQSSNPLWIRWSRATAMPRTDVVVLCVIYLSSNIDAHTIFRLGSLSCHTMTVMSWAGIDETNDTSKIYFRTKHIVKFNFFQTHSERKRKNPFWPVVVYVSVFMHT